jgi:O-antigen/teichoic acid export membrane protein
MAVTLALAHFIPRFFAVPPEFAGAVITLFLLAGIATALDFPLSIFEGILESVGRFDQLYGIRILGQLLRAGLIILALTKGWGLLGLGAMTIIGTLVPRFLVVPLSSREMPRLSLRPKWVHRETLRAMVRYGSISFSVGIGQRLKTSFYPLVLAKVLTASAVTLFAIPMKILQVPMAGIGNMTEYVNPMSSHLEAHESRDRLRSVLITSVQGSYLFLAPIAAIFLLFGKDLISLWVGRNYVVTYPVLVMLTFGLGSDAAQSSAQSMLFGLGKHKGLIAYRTAEGLAILALGIPMAKTWGINGFAIATMIPLVIVNCFLIPRHLGLLLDLPFRRYLIEALVVPNLLAVPMALALWAVHAVFLMRTWPALIGASLVGILVYSLTLLAAASPRLPQPFAWLGVELLAIVRTKVVERFYAQRTGTASERGAE